jgi:hypothetical protein
MFNILIPELHTLYTFIALFKKKITSRTSMISVFLFRKKNTAKLRYSVNKIVIFIETFLRDSRFFLTSSLYRSMWTIGQASVLRKEKYRPIVCKIRYLVFVGKFKKNVTRQTWRALFHFGEYFFQPFWRVFEKNDFPHCNGIYSPNKLHGYTTSTSHWIFL